MHPENLNRILHHCGVQPIGFVQPYLYGTLSVMGQPETAEDAAFQLGIIQREVAQRRADRERSYELAVRSLSGEQLTDEEYQLAQKYHAC